MPEEYVREQSLFEAWQVSPDDAAEIADWCGGTAVERGVQVDSTWGTLVIPHGCWVVYDVNNNEFDAMSDQYFQQVCFQEQGITGRVIGLAVLLVALIAVGVILTMVFG